MMKRWKATLMTTGIALELVSLGGMIYISSIVPAIDPKALLFFIAPVCGLLYGAFVIGLGLKLKV